MFVMCALFMLHSIDPCNLRKENMKDVYNNSIMHAHLVNKTFIVATIYIYTS